MTRSKVSSQVGFLRQLLVLVLLLCSLTISTQAQPWEIAVGTDATDEAFGAVQAPNGDFITAGYTQISGKGFQVYAVRTDIDGDIVWKRNFGGQYDERGYDLIKVSDGYLVAGDAGKLFLNEQDAFLLKFDEDGYLLWSKSYGGTAIDKFSAIIPTSDGGFAMAGTSASYGDGSNDLYLVKTNAAGDTLWTAHYDNAGLDDQAKDLVETPDGLVLVGKSGRIGADVFLLKADKNTGAEISRGFIDRRGAFDVNAILRTSDNGFLLSGSYTDNGVDACIIKVLPNFKEESSSFYSQGLEQSFSTLVALPDGGFTAAGYIVEDAQSNLKAYLVRLNSSRVFIGQKRIGGNTNKQINTAISTPDGGFLFAGWIGDQNFVTDFLILKTDSDFYLPEKFIEGKVFSEINGNCQFDNGEKPLRNWLIGVTGDSGTSYFTTDDAGFYRARVDSGRYTVKVFPSNNYWQPCFNDRVVQFAGTSDTLSLNFPIEALYSCPNLEVDISTGALTKCKDATYAVSYCNQGATDATSAKVEVRFDSYLTVKSASLPFSRLADNTFRFDIGTLKAGDCGQFSVLTTLDCDAPATGQTHCTTAHIFPDSICTVASAQWDGSSLKVDGQCQNDTIQFRVTNTGRRPMRTGTTALIVEDEILIRSVPIQLDTQKVLILEFPGTGSTYRIITEHTEGHPGNSAPTTAVEGCTSGTTWNKGIVTRFEEDEKDPFVAADCHQNSESNQTYQLRGYPKGLSDSLISAQTDLEFHIRFQNVGTDSVARLVIRDTIAKHLDISAIQPGASSHPYQLKVYGDGILKITFEDLGLPGSSVDESGSAGFVNFRISQKPVNPAGTVITNRASINMGYRQPAPTNVTRHVIGGAKLTDFMEVRTDVGEVYVPGVEVIAFPNPFSTTVVFEIKGMQTAEPCTIEIFDTNGNKVRKEYFSQNRLELLRSDLTSGIYYYRIMHIGRLVNTGKIIAGK